MKDLFGISAVITSIGFLIWTIGETFAYPQSPNVSFGSNPLTHLRGDFVGNGNHPILNNSSGQDFIITAIKTGGTNCTANSGCNTASNQNCGLKINGNWLDVYQTNIGNFQKFSLDDINPLNLVIHDGDNLTITGFSGVCWFYATGYYTHP